MSPYFDQMILSASPVELIRLLYQKAIAKVREAREHLAAGRIEERSAAINLTYRIIMELTHSVEPASAPELSSSLTALYFYIQERVLKANMNQTDAPLAEVLGLLTTLSEAWNAVPSSAEASDAPTPWAMNAMESDGAARVAFTA